MKYVITTLAILALPVYATAQTTSGSAGCTVITQVAEGWYQVVAEFGFVEIPDLRLALSRAKGLHPEVDLDKAIFVASRDLIVHREGSRALRRRRMALFAWLFRNAVKAVDRFNLPPKNVIEIARQIEI